MTVEQFASLPYPLLDEECWSTWHLYLYHYSNNNQYRPKEKKADEGYESVEYEFKYHDMFKYNLVFLCVPLWIPTLPLAKNNQEEAECHKSIFERTNVAFSLQI